MVLEDFNNHHNHCVQNENSISPEFVHLLHLISDDVLFPSEILLLISNFKTLSTKSELFTSIALDLCTSLFFKYACLNPTDKRPLEESRVYDFLLNRPNWILLTNELWQMGVESSALENKQSLIAFVQQLEKSFLHTPEEFNQLILDIAKKQMLRFDFLTGHNFQIIAFQSRLQERMAAHASAGDDVFFRGGLETFSGSQLQYALT